MLHKLTVSQLFLIDGLGALLTALMLGLVLPRFEVFFGVPPALLYPLAGVGAAFAVYSLSCHRWAPRPRLLLGIATANTLYCLVTLLLLGFLHQAITGWGVAYFVGEILLVLGLVWVEVTVARREGQNS